MKLFADHSNGFVTLVFAESIHDAIQTRIFINNENCTPILSQITREEPIRVNLINEINKKEIVNQLVKKENYYLKKLCNKDKEVDQQVIVNLLNEHNPTVWFNFSNSEGEEWCATTMIKAGWTSFGQALSDYLQTF